MFTIRSFIKKGLFGAIGKMADYQIILNAVGWFDKGVLSEEDLEEIELAIDGQYSHELQKAEDEDIPFQEDAEEE